MVFTLHYQQKTVRMTVTSHSQINIFTATDKHKQTSTETNTQKQDVYFPSYLSFYRKITIGENCFAL